MTSREELIEKAAKAIIDVQYPSIGWRTLSEDAREFRRKQARAALAVFEEQQKPTEDEREALARLFDGHWMTPLGKCACGWVHPQYGSRHLDPLYVRQHLADAVAAAGFRRPVSPEPSADEDEIDPEICKGCDEYDPHALCMVAAPEPQAEPTDAQVRAAAESLAHSAGYVPEPMVRAALRAASSVQGESR